MLKESVELEGEPRITPIRADKYGRGDWPIRAYPRNPRLDLFGSGRRPGCVSRRFRFPSRLQSGFGFEVSGFLLCELPFAHRHFLEPAAIGQVEMQRSERNVAFSQTFDVAAGLDFVRSVDDSHGPEIR